MRLPKTQVSIDMSAEVPIDHTEETVIRLIERAETEVIKVCPCSSYFSIQFVIFINTKQANEAISLMYDQNKLQFVMI